MQRWLRTALVAGAGLAFLVFLWLWFAPCGFGGCAPVSDLEEYQAEGSELLDMHGKPFATLATVNRRIVSIDSVPEFLPKAFLAVEDQRFFQHGGVDWKRMGAAVTSLFRPGRAEGGSTITMQLARNLFPEHLPYTERSPRRKLMEIRVARQIERAFSKEKILELYLNHIYLGEGAYGVEAAAQTYFGKPAAQLTLAEAATIGGLPKAPSQINPRENRAAARKRRDLVLTAMGSAGYAPAAEVAAARESPIRLSRRARSTTQKGSYFIERVRRELEREVGERMYTAGLRVVTTLDPVAQAASETELARQLDAVEAGQFGGYSHPTYPEAKGETADGNTSYLQGMAIIMDAATGEVRALVGGRDYEDSNFDRAFQAVRQPGSAFKPFVYLAALESGIAPTDRIEDAPVKLVLAGGRTWQPRNYTGRYDGPITVRDALTRSKNTVTVRLAQQVGMSRVIQTARKFGITTPISNVPATALGSAEVRPAELVGAYAAFANGGEKVRPHFIRRVESRHGEVLWEAEPEKERVAEAGVMFVLTSMLRDVVDRGTGTPARSSGFRGASAGKTGTTNAATDIWFVGYTPELVGAVWMGLDKPKTIVRGASGGTIAAPVWGRIMRRIYANRAAPRGWNAPASVVTEQVDRATGLAVDASCPARGETYTEYFVNTRPPRQICYPGAEYPGMAVDRGWLDEEWGGYAYEEMDTAVAVPDLRESGITWPELEARRRSGQSAPPPPPPVGELPRGRGRIILEPEQPLERPRQQEPTPAPPRQERPRVLGEPVETGTPTTPPDTSSGG